MLSGTKPRNDFSLACVVASACLYVATLSAGGKLGLASGCLSCLLLIWVSSGICQRLLPQSIAPRMLLWVQAIQPLALLGVILSGVETQVVGVDLAEHPGIVCGAQMWGVLGIVLAGCLLWVLAGPAARRAGAAPFLRAIPYGSEKFILGAIVLGSLRQVASLALTGGFRYVILVLSAPLELVAFAAGRLGDEQRKWRRAALMVLVVSAALGFLLGTRQAIIGVALYGIGRISTLRGRRLRKMLLACGISAIPVLYVIGLVGVIRGVTGRDDIRLLDPSNISKFIDEAKDTARGGDTTSATIKTNAFGRLFAWPTAVTTIRTPDPIPYLGLESILGESLKIARITGGDEEALDSALDDNLGIAKARDYGFTVNRFTSVEFNLIADGWARSGAVGVVLVTVIVCLALTLFEWSVSALRFLSGPSKLLLTCILLSAAAGTRVYPLLVTLRALVLQTAAWTCILFIAKHNLRKRSSRARLPLWAASNSIGGGLRVVVHRRHSDTSATK